MNQDTEKCIAYIHNFLRASCIIPFKQFQHLELKQKLKQNQQFQNKYHGKRCFVLGNGPSLQKQNLTLLQNEKVFTVNNFYLHPQTETIAPDFHLLADPVHFKDEKNFVLRTEQAFSELVKKSPNIKILLPTVGYKTACKYQWESKWPIYFFSPIYDYADNLVRTNCSRNITCFSTVVQYAIEWAIFMGFAEIYLLGCDCTGIISVCESRKNNKKSGENLSQHKEHFYEEQKLKDIYMANAIAQNSCELEFESWTSIFRGYRILNEWCKKQGIIFQNATEGGILDSVPLVRYESLFSQGDK